MPERRYEGRTTKPELFNRDKMVPPPNGYRAFVRKSERPGRSRAANTTPS